MNILVIGKFYTEGFALHIVETLASMGHSVRRFEPGFRSGRIGGRLGHRLDQVRGVIHSLNPCSFVIDQTQPIDSLR